MSFKQDFLKIIMKLLGKRQKAKGKRQKGSL
jgi:hypothetical protein